MAVKSKQKFADTLTVAKLNNSDAVCQTANSFRVFNVKGTCTSKGCTSTETVTIYPRTASNEAAVKRVLGRAPSC
jgi:hypothetical protein